MNVVVSHQAQALAAAGHQVTIFTRRSEPGTEVSYPVPGVRLEPIDAGPPRHIPKGAHEDLIEEFSGQLWGRLKADVVHAQHWFSGMAALPVARAGGIPLVQSFHSIAADAESTLDHGERPESPGRMAGETWLAAHSDLVVAISQAEADTVVSRLGGDPTRIAVVPPGVDSTVFHPIVGAPPDPPQLVVAARLEELKGVALAVETLAMVRDPRPQLVIAGEAAPRDRSYRDHLEQLVADSGLDERVSFVGVLTRAEVADLLAGAAAVLIPSYSETYGLVALEAGACGVPVVATATGGLKEAVVDGSTGLLMEDRQPASWARAIDRILADSVLAETLGTAARRRAESLSWEAATRSLLRAYCRVVRCDEEVNRVLASV